MNATQEQTSQGAALEDLTMCLQIRFNAPTARRKANMDFIEAGDTDKDLLSVSKIVFDSDEFRAIRRHRAYMKAFIKSKSLPAPFLKSGIFSLPLPSVETVQNKIDEMTEEDRILVGKFVRRYDGSDGKESLEAAARRRLGAQFDPADYPSAEKLERQFSIETMFLETKTPTKLREISPTIYEAERRKAEARLEVAAQDAELLLFAEMQKLVEKMVDQLGHTDDGKKKAFHKRNAEKLSNYLENLAERNIFQNQDISKLSHQAAGLLAGMDVDALKKHDDYREAVRANFAAIGGRLEKLVVDAPTRMVTFDEEV